MYVSAVDIVCNVLLGMLSSSHIIYVCVVYLHLTYIAGVKFDDKQMKVVTKIWYRKTIIIIIIIVIDTISIV